MFNSGVSIWHTHLILSIMSWLDIAGLGMDLFGGLLGYDAQKSANEVNLQLARENNAWSEKMMQKQMDYNTEMWNKQNEYNSPSAQMKRLQDAGLSPYRMMQQGATGNATSAQGVGLPSPQQTRLEAEKFEFGAASQRLLQMSEHEHQTQMAEADTALKREELKGLKIDNLYKEKRITAELAEMASRTKSFDAKTALDNAIHDFERDAKTLKLRQLESGINYQAAQTDLLEVQKLISDKQLSFMDEQHQTQMALAFAEYQNRIADTAVKYSQVELNKANKEKIGAEINKINADFLSTCEDITGKKLSNGLQAEIYNYNIEQARLQALPKTAEERTLGGYHPERSLLGMFDFISTYIPTFIKLK